jgi:DNA-binding protein
MKKDDRVTIRLSEELRDFEAFGFKNVTEYIKAALTAFNEKQEFEVIKSNEIISSISDLITIMEAERDNCGHDLYPKEKEFLIAALYQSAKPIADNELIKLSPINNCPYPDDLKDGEEHPETFYKHTWAL